MGYIGYANPDAGKHFCDPPFVLFGKHWALWECDECHKIWRREFVYWGEGDNGWDWHEYRGVKVV